MVKIQKLLIIKRKENKNRKKKKNALSQKRLGLYPNQSLIPSLTASFITRINNKSGMKYSLNFSGTEELTCLVASLSVTLLQ